MTSSLASKLSSHRPSLALDGSSINSEANGRSPLPVFSLPSVASVLVEATAYRLVNSLIFLNKIQQIKDIRQSKFSASISKAQLVTWQFVQIFSAEVNADEGIVSISKACLFRT